MVTVEITIARMLKVAFKSSLLLMYLKNLFNIVIMSCNCVDDGFRSQITMPDAVPFLLET